MIDLRSDTVTRPTPQMREAMLTAPVGDDVYAEDPSITELERYGAELLGHEASLFCVSGSLANLLGVWLSSEPGTEVLCDVRAHIVRAEMGAHAVLHGVTTRTWTSSDGVADVDTICALISDRTNPYLVATAAVEIENTHNFGGGTVWSLPQVGAVAQACHERGVRLHLDGARLGNACAETGATLAQYAGLADTATLCLSKGLGAPVGTLLAGSAADIERARVQRKRLGGGWRQAGMLAAAGMYALRHHLDRLGDDHVAARAFAAEVAKKAPRAVGHVPTNIVVVDTGALGAATVCAAAQAAGVVVSALDAHTIRAVTHLDVTEAECVQAGAVIADILSAQASTAA